MLICTPTGVVRDSNFFLNAKGIRAVSETEATQIDKVSKKVTCKSLVDGTVTQESYDSLIIATGATPIMPRVPGIDLKGITTLQSMADADLLRKVRDEGKVKKIVIVGGGLIGMDSCEALELAGISITVIEMMPQLLTFLDPELAKIVENHVRSKGANVIAGNGVVEFLGKEGKLTGVKLQNNTELECEMAVVAIGVRPNVTLAKNAGLTIGKTGGIEVNGYMQTSDPTIYAVGDCTEKFNRITKKNCLAPYGDLANLQGRVAGENAIHPNTAKFSGTQQTGICKVFDFAAGTTGLSEKIARQEGINIETVINASPDKPGFMPSALLISKIILNRDTQELIGYQCVGPGDVSKQIAMAAMAIRGNLKLSDLVDSDLPYAPPFSLAIDHFVAGMHIMENKLRGLFFGISASEVKQKIDANQKLFLLDTRGPDEYELMRLGVGETLIPLGAIRKRLSELPTDKNTEIVCYCKISLRGYEAARILMGAGFTNVKVLEGGVMAWPYKREK